MKSTKNQKHMRKTKRRIKNRKIGKNVQHRRRTVKYGGTDFIRRFLGIKTVKESEFMRNCTELEEFKQNLSKYRTRLQDNHNPESLKISDTLSDLTKKILEDATLRCSTPNPTTDYTFYEKHKDEISRDAFCVVLVIYVCIPKEYFVEDIFKDEYRHLSGLFQDKGSQSTRLIHFINEVSAKSQQPSSMTKEEAFIYFSNFFKESVLVDPLHPRFGWLFDQLRKGFGIEGPIIEETEITPGMKRLRYGLWKKLISNPYPPFSPLIPRIPLEGSSQEGPVPLQGRPTTTLPQ